MKIPVLLWMFRGLSNLSNWVSFHFHGAPREHFTLYKISIHAGVLTIPSESLKLSVVVYGCRYTYPIFPENLLQDFLLCCKVFTCVTLTVFLFAVVLFHKKTKQKKVKMK